MFTMDVLLSLIACLFFVAKNLNHQPNKPDHSGNLFIHFDQKPDKKGNTKMSNKYLSTTEATNLEKCVSDSITNQRQRNTEMQHRRVKGLTDFYPKGVIAKDPTPDREEVRAVIDNG